MGERKTYDWEAAKAKWPAVDIFNLGSGESALVKMFKLQIQVGGNIEDMLQCSGISIAKFEFRLPQGIADLVLFHTDGGVSIVEFKDKLDNRTVLAGVGQLTMYAVQVGYSKSTSYIHKYLVAPFNGESKEAKLIKDSCLLAGVKFVPTGEIYELQGATADFLVEHGLLSEVSNG